MVEQRSGTAQPLPPADAQGAAVAAEPLPTSGEEAVTSTRFNAELWRRFIRMARPYWTMEKRWVARGMLVLLLGLLLGLTEFSVLFNQQSGEITSGLAAKDPGRFWSAIRQFFILLVVAVPIYSFYYYVRDKLSLNWRGWLTDHLLSKYFANGAYYTLTSNDEIDNPDQRICEDISLFTTKSLSFLLIFVGAVMQLIAFSAVLWNISQVLVGFLIIYATVGTLITTLGFGRGFINLNYNQIQQEANFRSSLLRVRDNAESIAFYRGEDEESSRVKRRFKKAYNVFNKLLNLQLKLYLFQYSFNFMTIILPSVILAPRVLSGELEIGRVIQAGGAFTAILAALSMFIENIDSLSRFAAGIDRLDSLSKALESTEPENANVGREIRHREGQFLDLQHVTLQPPKNNERKFVKNLSVKVKKGDHLMIVGASGSGKSSLLRAVAGLWNSGSGIIVHPQLQDVMFLPQQPYMTSDTLRNQLLYPDTTRQIPDDQLHAVLDEVNLGELVSRHGGLDTVLDWEKTLSVGEQQRLAFARLLLTKPRYAMLDEATSALDPANEDSLYAVLAATPTTFVSVSHRPVIVKYHKQVLEIMADGQWQLRGAKKYSREIVQPNEVL